MVNARTAQQRGYILVVTMFMAFMVAVLMIALTRWWQAEARREKERELLWVGSQFRTALAGYAAATPAGTSPRPTTLAELLRDERDGTVRRHLRRMYVDPLTASDAWGIVRAEDGTVLAVHSRSETRPLDANGSSPRFHRFAGTTRYSEWQFGVLPVPPRQP
jgi:type II secretory pathway pseudopilin PulG